MNTIDNKTFTIGAVILSLGFVLSTIIGAYTFYEVRALDNTLSVTGSAKKSVVSDQVKWISQIARPARQSTLKTGYAQIASDLEIVKKFYKDNGITEDMLTISPVSMDEVWKNNAGANDEKEYTLHQTIEVNSADVPGITKLSKATNSLISQGVIFSTQYLSYSYSKLADVRVELLANAVADARARANQLVSGTGKSVGKLKSASSGVVQVLSANSVDVSDYGSYDTTSINKDIMVTVKAAFLLN